MYYSSIKEFPEVLFNSLPITGVYWSWALFVGRLVLQADMVFHCGRVTQGELVNSKDLWDGIQLV